MVAELRKISVVEVLVKSRGLHVVDTTLTVELIVLPVTFVSYGSVLVIELTETVHLILLPLTFIVTSILEKENSVTASHPVALVAFISSPIRNIFLDKVRFIVRIIIQMIKT